jgi:hypothetical protein
MIGLTEFVDSQDSYAGFVMLLFTYKRVRVHFKKKTTSIENFHKFGKVNLIDSGMTDSTIYSIGHGNKKLGDFIEELKSFNIFFLLDIRSKPYSKWSPHFNQNQLESELIKYNIKYVFVGDTLGGLPNDRSCYDFNGKVVYDFIKEKDFFKEGLKRLTIANEKQINIAIMCSESNPSECHRSKLIGQELLKQNISIKHITSKFKFKSQELVMAELTNGNGIVDLFGNKTEFTSRKAY